MLQTEMESVMKLKFTVNALTDPETVAVSVCSICSMERAMFGDKALSDLR